MREINVAGKSRSNLGKKASKEMRKEGLIPCNLYGEKKNADGLPEALSFAVPMAELRKVVYTLSVFLLTSWAWLRVFAMVDVLAFLSASLW